MVSWGGSALVGRVRLDERPAVLARLGMGAAEAAGLHDADLALRGSLQLGEAFLRGLAGDFSFVVWDSARGRLLAAVDALGVRGLFHTRLGNVLALSDTPGTLVGLPGFVREVDALSVCCALVRSRLHGHEPERTLFRDLRQLPPGHWLEAGTGEPTISRYWSARDLLSRPRLREPFPELDRAFRDLFVRAVSSRMPSNGVTACHLSGGLDSSSVACVAAQAAPEREVLGLAHLVRDGYQGAEPSGRSHRELRYVEAILERYPNVTLIREDAGERGFLEGLEPFWRHCADFPLNGLHRNWGAALSERAAAFGVDRILTGIYGNATLSWGGPPLPTRAHRLYQRARALFMPLRRQWRETTALRPEWIAEFDLEGRHWALSPEFRSMPLAKGELARFQPAYRAMYGHELLDPTIDLRVVEFCLQAPPGAFKRGAERRLLVRGAMRGIVPDVVLDRTDRGMQRPDWPAQMARQLPAFQEELRRLSGCDLARRFIDWEEVARCLVPPDLSDFSIRNTVLWERKILLAMMMGRFLEWVEQGAA